MIICSLLPVASTIMRHPQIRNLYYEVFPIQLTFIFYTEKYSLRLESFAAFARS